MKGVPERRSCGLRFGVADGSEELLPQNCQCWTPRNGFGGHGFKPPILVSGKSTILYLQYLQSKSVPLLKGHCLSDFFLIFFFLKIKFGHDKNLRQKERQILLQAIVGATCKIMGLWLNKMQVVVVVSHICETHSSDSTKLGEYVLVQCFSLNWSPSIYCSTKHIRFGKLNC